MRASELIDSPVYEDGRLAGIVRDLRVEAEPAADGSFAVLGLVLGDPGPRAAAAHAWGFAEGRAQGPWLLRRLVGNGASRFVPADRVVDWGPERLQIRGEGR
ncbi:MAG TPA: hypothetical protein VFY69_07060 [Solirubrobacterales bacterium]|nr:hypothetical protein [Solirubrobacterales bacterium]